MFRTVFLAALLALAFPLSLFAQADRYELGQRLRLFERTLEKHNEPAARKRALAHLTKATPAFFSGRLDKAAELLDLSRLALISDKEPGDAARYAESLVVRPGSRLAEAGSELPLTVTTFYTSSAAKPDKIQIRWELANGSEKQTKTQDLTALPLKASLRLPESEGDCVLRSTVLVDGKPMAESEQTVSVVKKLETRLEALRKGVAELEEKPASTEKATLGRLVQVLRDLAARRTLETNYPGARLVRESEEVLQAARAGKSYYGPERRGQFWVTVVSDKTTDPVRVQIPKSAKKEKPMPVVVALHGAGGSENMFFDGYGDGKVAKLCEERGWLLVATRTPLISFGGPDPMRVVDGLAKVYPVDTKKVYLVGHSMGAAQAVAAAGRRPERLAGVAALGGGGKATASDALKEVPFFVGVGEQDFALGGAKGLHAGLEKAGVRRLVFKKYEDVEHLIIVQLALPEVFAFFEKGGKGEK